MASKLVTLLGLAALGGGVYYIVSRDKKVEPDAEGNCPEGYHRMIDADTGADYCMRDDDPSMQQQPGAYTPGPGAYSPPGWDALLGTYQAAIYGHASVGDCQKLLGYFDSLEPETQAEADWIAARQTEVNTACAHQYSEAPTLPSVVSQWQDELNRCWTQQCDSITITNVIRALDSAATFYQGMIPGDQYQTIRYASQELSRIQNVYATSGKAPHVAGCGCASCQQAMTGEDDEPCCEACAMGTGACACSERNPFEENICQVPVATQGAT